MKPTRFQILFALLALGNLTLPSLRAEPLPNTKPLEEKGDLAALMVEGIGKYLDRELAGSVEKRKQYWKLDFSSPEAYAKSVQPNRERLKKILGVVDERVKFADIEYVGGPTTPSLVAETDLYKVYAIRWPVLPGVEGEGLLLEPKGKVWAQYVAIPDADWTPEQIVGLAPGVPKGSQYARRFAENGGRVIVPVLINRKDDYSQNLALKRATNQPHREFIYRMSYEMGRHIIGLEVQKVLAVVDWFAKTKNEKPMQIGVIGYGEGGLLSLYSAAVDERITGVLISGYVKPREELWKEPIYRNVWALLTEFGDAELLTLVQQVMVQYAQEPDVHGPPEAKPGRSGAAPGQTITPTREAAKNEYAQLEKIGHRFKRAWLESAENAPFTTHHPDWADRGTAPKDLRPSFDPDARQKRQFDQLVAFTQKLWRDSEPIRAARFAKCDYSSPEKYEASIEPIRQFFDEEIIGKLPAPTVPMNPKSREIYDTPKWKGYEVTLDLYPDVFAEGILLLPKDLKPNEKRPVVVCQHGLEGRPQDVCNPKEKTKYYNSFGTELADLGYIVYAPQNPYIGKDLFRVLQRKANPLKLSLFSFIVRQHERTLDWLSTLPNVDGDKIAFYGLSYGGKTAMRVPAILKKYCLSICSGDFNEWIGKNVSVTLDRSYMWTMEYEMFEFDLGNTFNYAEMAYLIAPRPFMVERGHDDGVGTDEMVSYEFAKVRYLYENKLKIPDRTAIEYFVGGHVINGKGTFAFLKQHLKWPPEGK